MVVIVDTREQRPLKFPKAITVKEEALPFGDYAMELDTGQRIPVVFERKNLSDLFGTMSNGYPRFKQEFLAAQEAGVQLVLGIESTLSDVLDGVPYSGFGGESCIKKLMTLWVKYGLRPVFCQSRAELACYIVETFAAIERNWQLA